MYTDLHFTNHYIKDISSAVIFFVAIHFGSSVGGERESVWPLAIRRSHELCGDQQRALCECEGLVIVEVAMLHPPSCVIVLGDGTDIIVHVVEAVLC